MGCKRVKQFFFQVKSQSSLTAVQNSIRSCLEDMGACWVHSDEPPHHRYHIDHDCSFLCYATVSVCDLSDHDKGRVVIDVSLTQERN